MNGSNYRKEQQTRHGHIIEIIMQRGLFICRDNATIACLMFADYICFHGELKIILGLPLFIIRVKTDDPTQQLRCCLILLQLEMLNSNCFLILLALHVHLNGIFNCR